MRSKAWVWAAWSWARVSGEGPPPSAAQPEADRGQQQTPPQFKAGRADLCCVRDARHLHAAAEWRRPTSKSWWPHGDEKAGLGKSFEWSRLKSEGKKNPAVKRG